MKLDRDMQTEIRQIAATPLPMLTHGSSMRSLYRMISTDQGDGSSIVRQAEADDEQKRALQEKEIM